MFYLTVMVVASGVLGLTGWVFYLTRNPWSFAILLLLFGIQMEEKSSGKKDNK